MLVEGEKLMNDKRCKALSDIRAVQFSLVDLTLFLDTHPDCQKALSEFNRLSHCLQQMLEQYQTEYGALYSYGVMAAGSGWNWVDCPWPWQA